MRHGAHVFLNKYLNWTLFQSSTNDEVLELQRKIQKLEFDNSTYQEVKLKLGIIKFNNNGKV